MILQKKNALIFLNLLVFLYYTNRFRTIYNWKAQFSYFSLRHNVLSSTEKLQLEEN
jgi:hypothetical protein